MRCLPFVVLAALAVSCNSGDCAQSADIQVTVAPNSDVSVGDVTRLHVMLSVADEKRGSSDIDVPMHKLSASGSTFVLHPDPAPSAKYDVSLTVQAFDGAGNLIAIGTASLQAVINGCNRLTVDLAGLPGNQSIDMSVPLGGPFDMVGVVPPDLAGCIGGTPDEDSDGRANSCDACPADSDPTPIDSDGDGLPDACDPDPTTPSNRLLYFEPFDVASGHWSGNYPISMSYASLDPGGASTLLANNGTDKLPANVRVQVVLFPLSGVPYNNPASIGFYIGSDPNPQSTTANGMMCKLSYRGGLGQDTLDLNRIVNGVIQPATVVPLSTLYSTSYRVRLTQNGKDWTCEAVANGPPSATVMDTTPNPPTAPQYLSLRVDSVAAHFHSVVAETKLP